MSFGSENPYHVGSTRFGDVAAMAEESERAAFIRRTYLHLAGAIFLFAGIQAAIFTLVPDETLARIVGQVQGYGWFLVLGGFLVVSWIADAWAKNSTSTAMQYLGLLLYVLAQSVIFVPLLWIANRIAPHAIGSAGLLTLVIFGGLTVGVFVTKSDFSGIGKYLWLGGIVAMGLIVCAIIFQFSLGVWFSAAMIGLAGGFILYDTSNVLHHYRTTQHVAAALALFASVALMFWYVLRLMMALNRN